MKDILEFREGNLIECGNQRVIIRKIEDAKSNRKVYDLSTMYNPPNNFSAYSEQVSPIFFREHHLVSLGFTKDNETGRHTLAGLTLCAYSWTTGTHWFNMGGGYTNYYVIPIDLVASPTLEELKQKGIEIPFVNAFQNYCSDNNINLDFALLY